MLAARGLVRRAVDRAHLQGGQPLLGDARKLLVRGSEVLAVATPGRVELLRSRRCTAQRTRSSQRTHQHSGCRGRRTTSMKGWSELLCAGTPADASEVTGDDSEYRPSCSAAAAARHTRKIMRANARVRGIQVYNPLVLYKSGWR